MANETWSYDRKRRHATDGTRWHFVMRLLHDPAIPYEEHPYELYFRDENRTAFGVLRFARRKDNPYRDYQMVVDKIMNTAEFRAALLDATTEQVWRKRWK